MRDLAEITRFFEKDRFATATTGIEIVAVDNNYAKCRMKIDERHMAALGQVMGGAIFTLADFAFAVATNDPDHSTMSSSSQISYLRVPKGKVLTAECRALKEGRRICFYEVEVTDDLGNPIANAIMSGCHM